MKKFKKRAVFLDRDGTINYDFGYVYKFSDFIFRPHVIKCLRFLSKKKYLIFIVTNQAGIAKGKFNLTSNHQDLKFCYCDNADISFINSSNERVMVAILLPPPKLGSSSNGAISNTGSAIVVGIFVNWPS